MSIASDKLQAAEWARRLLSKPAGKVLILDTETCDLNGEIIELGVIDTDGNVVYNHRFKPLSAIQPGAQAVHGLTLEMLENEPDFCGEAETVRSLLVAAEIVLIYNAPFDVRCLEVTCEAHEVERINFYSACVMRMYAQWVGEINPRRGGYKWQKLTGGDHSAVGDAKAALELLYQMAGARQMAGVRVKV